jgi:hypothetical protein
MLPSPPLPKNAILSKTPLPSRVQRVRVISPHSSIRSTWQGPTLPLGRSVWRLIGGDASASAEVAIRGAPQLPVRRQCQSRSCGGNHKSNEFRSESDASPFARLCDTAKAWQKSIPISPCNPTEPPETGLLSDYVLFGENSFRSIPF